MLRWITAGESHGPELIATLEGLPEQYATERRSHITTYCSFLTSASAMFVLLMICRGSSTFMCEGFAQARVVPWQKPQIRLYASRVKCWWKYLIPEGTIRLSPSPGFPLLVAANASSLRPFERKQGKRCRVGVVLGENLGRSGVGISGHWRL